MNNNILNNKYIMPYITATTSDHLSVNNTGLGNVMFQIASCIGIAVKCNTNIIFNSVNEYCNILYNRYNFNHKNTIFRKVYNKTNFSINFENTVREISHSIYQPDILDTIKNNPSNHIVFGYLEFLEYFDNVVNDIQEIFEPDEESLTIINSKYGHILNDTNRTTISIHFRGKEFLKLGKVYDYDYFKRAIEYFKENVSNPYFLVFTDDKESINLDIFNDIDYEFVKNDYDYLDLWTMSLCKHNIIFNSTFSWWGAFLNKNKGKIVLYKDNTSQNELSFNKIFIGI